MEIYRPAEIEHESMRIIASELQEKGISLPEENAAVIKRVIHATADFEYAESLRFSQGAVHAAVDALRTGVPVVTDTNMAFSGVSRPALGKLGCQKYCFMADPDIAERAREQGVTRAVISVRHAAQTLPQCIYAVGNAPTALFELVLQMEHGFRPSLVIGVPVGFVNVTEGKESLWDCCIRREIPVIVAWGRKGGSTVAAAILNALLYQAAEMLDPEMRGW